MPHPAPAHKSYSDRTSLYQEITDKIIAELEQGRVPWVQPWAGVAGVSAPLGLPRNASTGRPYSGINILILWLACTERGFTGQTWLTFRQALKLGAHVRKGERGTTVVYADRFIPYRERTRAAEAGDAPEAIPFLKRFTVFNADQCEDLPAEVAPPQEPFAENLILPQAEVLIRATGADIRIGGDRAFYVASADYIQVPPPSAFFEPINFHRTLCHELGHWSGAAHRLNRDLSGGFGSPSIPAKNYARKSPAPLSAPRCRSCRRYAMPIISARGSNSCARSKHYRHIAQTSFRQQFDNVGISTIRRATVLVSSTSAASSTSEAEGIQASMIVAEVESIGSFVGGSISEPLLQGGVLLSVLAYMIQVASFARVQALKLP
jgi:antirestriction protein ArdC